MTAPCTDPAPRRLPLRGLLLVWLLFWALLFVLELQEHLRRGNTAVGWIAVWEGTSFIVATALAAGAWLMVRRLDRLLERPPRWFAAALLPLPLLAPAFVLVVYGLRIAIGRALDVPYRHAPWGALLLYESLKFAVFYALAVAIVFGVRSYLAMEQARQRAARAQWLAQQAQLVQLAQQMAPHFLFNALNTIAATLHDDPDRAERLLMRLSALLRAASDLARQPVGRVADEVRLAEGYAEIMHERFGDRVDVRFDIDPTLADCRLPSLALQPLLENAFRHGVEKHPGRCTIRIDMRRDAGRIRLTIEDDAGEFAAAAQPGVGIGNLRARLAALHGTRASLSIGPRSDAPGDRGVRATMVLPCEC